MGSTEGRPSERGSTRSRKLLRLAVPLFIAAAALALSLPAGAGAMTSTFRFPATRVHHGVVTFKLTGVSPTSIRSAYVRRGHKRHQLALARAQAAARRGVLRLHMNGVQVNRSRKARAPHRKKKKKPTLVVVTNPPPPPTPAPPKPAPTPAPGPVVSWRSPGSPPLSDAAAKALVTPRAETRPLNASANHYLPNAAELAAFHNAVFGGGANAGSRLDAFNPLVKYISGGFTGTTDEILQWGAHKWGIPEDVLRAVAVTESWWRQAGMGDRRDGVNASLYPAQSRIDADSVYETLGLMQIKWRPDGSLHPGTEPLRWKSTAFNVDYWGATVRYYYDGLCDWCAPGYGPGRAWESIGAHFNPSPWRNAGMLDYMVTVKGHVADRVWERPGF